MAQSLFFNTLKGEYKSWEKECSGYFKPWMPSRNEGNTIYVADMTKSAEKDFFLSILSVLHTQSTFCAKCKKTAHNLAKCAKTSNSESLFSFKCNH